MKTGVIFDKVIQNSILVSQIIINPNSIPDYLFIKIEASLITPIDTVKILTSLPLFYEPGNLNFFYKCLIPHNSLPSFDSEYYKIQYKLILIEFTGNNKNEMEFPFIVNNNSSFNDYKYDIFLDSDMIRIDNTREENETGFSEIVKYLRYCDYDNKIDNKLNYKVDDKVHNNLKNNIDNDLNYKKDHNIDNNIDHKLNYKIDNNIDHNIDNKIHNKSDNKLNYNLDNKMHNKSDNKLNYNLDNKIHSKIDIIEIKGKLEKLKDYNEIFKKIINKYKNKGDLYFHIKKCKKLEDKTLECEIKNEGANVLSLKYNKIFKKKMVLEIDFYKEVEKLRIYLIKNLSGDKNEVLLGEFDTRNMIYKKISLKRTWSDFCIKTIYFEMKIYLKIFVDDLNFRIYPIFV